MQEANKSVFAVSFFLRAVYSSVAPPEDLGVSHQNPKLIEIILCCSI